MKYKEEFSEHELLSFLPKYERENNTLIKELYRVLGDEFDDVLDKIYDLYKQLNVNTATWGLDIWESNLGLEKPHGLGYEERRILIKSKLKTFGKVSTETLENMVQDYFDQKVNVYFNGRLLFELPLGGGKHPKLTNKMIEAIENTKPAHLGYDIRFLINPDNSKIGIKSTTMTAEIITIYPREEVEVQDLRQGYKTHISTYGLVTVYPYSPPINLDGKITYSDKREQRIKEIELKGEDIE